MKRIMLLLLPFFVLGCSSDNEEVQKDKDVSTVELSDIKGAWTITNSSNAALKSIILTLNDNMSCVWEDKGGNTYAGPYWMLENVNDEMLTEQCRLMAVDNANRIHINTVKVIGHTESTNKELYLKCDLLPFMPAKNWSDFSEKVNSEIWNFWIDSTFDYTFDISEYTQTTMTLRLTDSSIRYDSYESRYPLRISNGTTLTLQRQTE